MVSRINNQGRGGTRKGAGRPRTELGAREILSIKLPHDLRKLIDAIVAGRKRSEYISTALEREESARYSRVLEVHRSEKSVELRVPMQDLDMWDLTVFATVTLDDVEREATIRGEFRYVSEAAMVTARIRGAQE